MNINKHKELLETLLKSSNNIENLYEIREGIFLFLIKKFRTIIT